MSRRKVSKKGKNRKIAYGITAVTLALLIIAAYYLFLQSNQTFKPKAAIVDHLSFRLETRNATFTKNVTNILQAEGFLVDYYSGNDVDVEFYRDLPMHGYGIIILRAHSALIGNTSLVALFTSEHFDPNSIPPAYYSDIQSNRLVQAYFTEEERARGEIYYGIAPDFIKFSMKGTFLNATIMMMGCDGLTYNQTAQAFIEKGAKVYIGWKGPVGVNQTDEATELLLQNLVTGKQTISQAVEKVSQKFSNPILRFYPPEAKDYRISDILVGLDVRYCRPFSVNKLNDLAWPIKATAKPVFIHAFALAYSLEKLLRLVFR